MLAMTYLSGVRAEVEYLIITVELLETNTSETAHSMVTSLYLGLDELAYCVAFIQLIYRM